MVIRLAVGRVRGLVTLCCDVDVACGRRLSRRTGAQVAMWLAQLPGGWHHCTYSTRQGCSPAAGWASTPPTHIPPFQAQASFRCLLPVPLALSPQPPPTRRPTPTKTPLPHTCSHARQGGCGAGGSKLMSHTTGTWSLQACGKSYLISQDTRRSSRPLEISTKSMRQP